MSHRVTAMRLRFHRFVQPQELLLSSVVLLLALGTIMVFSAGAFYHRAPDSFFLLRRQLLWLPIAVCVGVFFSLVDYRLYRRYYPYVLALGISLLVLVLVPGVGRLVNNSRRWLPLGGFFQFQPSEFAKLAAVIFVAGFLSVRPERTRSFVGGFVPVAAGVLALFGLILAEPDLGSSVFVLALGVALALIAGMRLVYLLGNLLVVVPILAAYTYVHWDTVSTRLRGMVEPEGQYQTMQSLIALGSGHWFGVGLGAGAQKLRYLPEAHTDFIFAVIGEELGFVGCVAVIILFLALIWSGVAIAWRAGDLFGFLLASGITLALAAQAAVNIAVVTGTAPTKGMPLPLLSFGGSGLCMTLAQVGILVSVARASADPAGAWKPRAGVARGSS